MTKDTKTALLDIAEAAARAKGFDGFSYADLSEAVGIRKASIHYHFPTKAGLSAALMDRYQANIAETCREIAATNEIASHQLLGLIALYRAASNEGKTLCLCVSLTTSHHNLSDEVNGKLTEFREMMVAKFTDVFTLGTKDRSVSDVKDAVQEARATLALLEGAHLAARAAESVEVFDQATAVLKSRCLRRSNSK